MTERRLKNHESDLKNARDAVDDVKKAARFLEDLETFLALWQGGDTSGIRRQFRQDLQTFFRSFGALLELLEGYQAKLRAEAVSQRLQDERVALEQEAAERKRREVAEAKKREEEQAAAAERRKHQEAEARRKAADEAAAVKAQEAEARRRADAEELERRRRAEEDRARSERALAEARRQADEEAKRRDEARRRLAAKPVCVSNDVNTRRVLVAPGCPARGPKPPPRTVPVPSRPAPVVIYYPVRVTYYPPGGCRP